MRWCLIYENVFTRGCCGINGNKTLQNTLSLENKQRCFIPFIPLVPRYVIKHENISMIKPINKLGMTMKIPVF